MNTRKNRNLKSLRKYLGLHATQSQIRITSEQYCGDPTDEIASYKATPATTPSRPQYAGLDEFERDFHWFLS